MTETAASDADTARAEVAMTLPREAPLPDPAGLAFATSPVDLPEPDAPLPRPLAWTATVILVACLVLALLNAGAIRSWSYELAPTAFNQRIVESAEAWYDLTAAIGLNRPVDAMRAQWKAGQAARFGGQETQPNASEEPTSQHPHRSP